VLLFHCCSPSSLLLSSFAGARVRRPDRHARHLNAIAYRERQASKQASAAAPSSPGQSNLFPACCSHIHDLAGRVRRVLVLLYKAVSFVSVRVSVSFGVLSCSVPFSWSCCRGERFVSTDETLRAHSLTSCGHIRSLKTPQRMSQRIAVDTGTCTVHIKRSNFHFKHFIQQHTSNNPNARTRAAPANERTHESIAPLMQVKGRANDSRKQAIGNWRTPSNTTGQPTENPLQKATDGTPFKQRKSLSHDLLQLRFVCTTSMQNVRRSSTRE
jgi:hypothetical protein